MIEEVAKAVFAQWRAFMLTEYPGSNIAASFEELSGTERKFAFMNARAAVAAMREPTEEMVKAGEQEFFEYRETPSDWTLEATRGAWREMIDAILSEKH